MSAVAYARMAAEIRAHLALDVSLLFLELSSEDIAYQVWSELTAAEARRVRWSWPGKDAHDYAAPERRKVRR